MTGPSSSGEPGWVVVTQGTASDLGLAMGDSFAAVLRPSSESS